MCLSHRKIIWNKTKKSVSQELEIHLGITVENELVYSAFLFLYTEWSIYEVKLMFVIIRLDGNTDVYTAREIAHHWVKQTHTQKQNTELNVVQF